MAKSTKQTSKKSSSSFLLFDAMNYKLMIVGAVLIALGFILMSGGGAELSGEANTAETFDTSIYSFRRIVLAPIVVVIGFVVEVFAIFYKTPNTES
tara:strand:- start:1546 stop:1833 length:288 start_codon:yes stop_codon:yes gene_type:complete